MISKAADVQRYIAELPAERRVAIEKLRRLCQQHLKGYEESMDFGMPVYKRNGVAEIAFASQKQYISFYVMKKRGAGRVPQRASRRKDRQGMRSLCEAGMYRLQRA